MEYPPVKRRISFFKKEEVMRENALESGIATREELPGLQKEIDE